MKVGDRVKLKMFDCDLCGTITAVDNKLRDEGLQYLVEEDDGTYFWYPSRLLEPTDIPKGELLDGHFGGTPIVRYDSWVVSNDKNKYTKENIPDMIAECKEMEEAGATGYCFICLKKCIEALGGEYKEEPKIKQARLF